MAGLCFYGTIDLTQYGIQSVQGALFIIITENTFTPMYSILSLFPQGFPLFIRERRSGLYDTLQYYLSTVIALVSSIHHFFCVYKLHNIKLYDVAYVTYYVASHAVSLYLILCTCKFA